MNTTAPTAREQFTNDISLVLDNDRASYEKIQRLARTLNTYELADAIRDYVETAITRVLEKSTWVGVGSLLIQQISLGWGIEPFMDYAKSIKAEQESAGV